jgi:formimidoylglutamate deiminase
VLDDSQLRLYAHDDRHLLDSMIFANRENPVLDVMVNGHWTIRDKKHALEQVSADEFANVLAKISV